MIELLKGINQLVDAEASDSSADVNRSWQLSAHNKFSVALFDIQFG